MRNFYYIYYIDTFFNSKVKLLLKVCQLFEKLLLLTTLIIQLQEQLLFVIKQILVLEVSLSI